MDLDSMPKPHVLRALALFASDRQDRALLLALAAGAKGDGTVREEKGGERRSMFD